jgi:hypothetical protein
MQFFKFFTPYNYGQNVSAPPDTSHEHLHTFHCPLLLLCWLTWPNAPAQLHCPYISVSTGNWGFEYVRLWVSWVLLNCLVWERADFVCVRAGLCVRKRILCVESGFCVCESRFVCEKMDFVCRVLILCENRFCVWEGGFCVWEWILCVWEQVCVWENGFCV